MVRQNGGVETSMDRPAVVVSVEHEAAMIGDTLNTLPFILALADRHQCPVHVVGKFNPAVQPLVSHLPVIFASPPAGMSTIAYTANVQRSWDYVGDRHLHMAQGHFALADMPMPELPICLPLRSEWCGLQPGIVISPFCGSEGQGTERHVRVWFADRWMAVIDALLARDDSARVYIGGGPNDDPTPFLRDRVTPVIGYPLPQVLDLIQRAPLFLSIDTGTAHLAHYGGVSRHVLLYSACIMKTTHENPRATVIQAWPSDITPEMVIDAATEILERSVMYVRKDADGDYKVVTEAGEVISRHSCRDWADQAVHKLNSERERVKDQPVSPQP